MIVKMKRLTLLCLTDDRDAALEQLRALSVVHVTDRRPPAGDELDALRARLAEEQRALEALPESEPGAGVRPARWPMPATWSRRCSRCSIAALGWTSASRSPAASSRGTSHSATSSWSPYTSFSARACPIAVHIADAGHAISGLVACRLATP